MNAQTLNQADVNFFQSTQRVRNECKHELIVTNWTMSDKAKNACQLMCCKCMMLVNMNDICNQHAKFMAINGVFEQAAKQAREAAQAAKAEKAPASEPTSHTETAPAEPQTTVDS